MGAVEAEIIVEGKVQKVGYRDYVQEVARKLNVKGYVENMRDGSVKIICETQEEILKKFIQEINVRTDLITVENIKVAHKKAAIGKFRFFDIRYGTLEEELGERIGSAFKIAVATRQDIKEMHHDLRGSINSMCHDLKGSIMSMHQDLETSIVSMHEDMNRNFKEMAERYDAISGELLKTREELKRAVDSLVELVRKFLERE